MNIELLQETKYDLWQKVIHKSKIWTLMKLLLPVASLESIRILPAYATHHGFKLYQIDVKIVFLNGPIKKDVYVEQPPRLQK
jgi:hypothetical protein